MTTVLVVDDSAVDRRLVGGLLEKRPDWKIAYATDGVEALALIKDVEPDLIVTDLRMPRMDGLQLVKTMRSECPNVPVMLMTAHGSENLAVEALEQGAASYVPKAQLADKLVDTVEQILTRARAHRNYDRVISCLNRTDFAFFLELENDPALIDPLVDLVQQMVADVHLCDFRGQLRIGVALREALLNALYHGNLEIGTAQIQPGGEDERRLVEQRRLQPPYQHRRILVDVKTSTEEARFVIRDEGPGFDVATILSLSRPGALEPRGKRGLSLMRTFMDEVIYNDAGNEVTLVKRREPDPNRIESEDP